MARKPSEYQQATAALKRALKKQKLTYRDLARGLHLSESGVKKILGAEDGSFQRIASMARFVGLSVRELLEGAQDETRELSFPLAQQEFLLAHPRAFELYWRLVYERLPLTEAERAGGLKSTESFSLLRKLDQHGLLELLPGGRVRVPPVQQVRWVGGGPLVERLYREWSQNFVRRVAGASPPAGAEFRVRYYKVSPALREELVRSLRELEAQFSRRAIQEMRAEDAGHEHLRWLFAVDNRGFLDG